jgi:hypothetical protein
MANLLVDPKDQAFVLHDMLKVEELCDTPAFNHLSRKIFDRSLDAARELAEKEFYPVITEADSQGCRLENGQVKVPRCFQRLKKLYTQGGWTALDSARTNGGQGYPMSVWLPVAECFMPNGAFMWLMNKPFSGTALIEMFGSDSQKKKYLPKMVAGQWGSVVAANDDESGCDVSMQTTTAVKAADGSYRIRGIKGHVTGGDMDLFDNLIHLVLARVEGDPLDQPSIFLVPQYQVNDDETLGPRNDFTIVELQDKMGFKGTPTCRVSYGDHDRCHGELLGQPREAMLMVLPLLQNGYICCGIQATSAASAAYRHALDYARRRKQGATLQDAQDPNAPRVAIIAHPDVRRMLLWMKSQAEGLRALLYFTGLCIDKAKVPADPDESAQWAALRDMLMPLCRIHSADAAFRVCETAIQVHGRYGYFKGTVVEQLLRDVKVQSIWELTSGLHALMFVAQMMPRNEGRDFGALLDFMNKIIADFKDTEDIADLTGEIQRSVDLLGATAGFMGACAQANKLMVPISNAVPFMQCMGTVTVGWLLYWQAGLATLNLSALCRENGVDLKDAESKARFLAGHGKAAFLAGKVHGARHYLKNILPHAKAIANAIENEELSILAIPNEGF